MPLNRTLDYDDLLAGLRVPVLITHGLEDDVVLPAMGRHHANTIPNAQTSYYPHIGHAPFWEDPHRFNAELRTFAASLSPDPAWMVIESVSRSSRQGRWRCDRLRPYR